MFGIVTGVFVNMIFINIMNLSAYIHQKIMDEYSENYIIIKMTKPRYKESLLILSNNLLINILTF